MLLLQCPLLNLLEIAKLTTLWSCLTFMGFLVISVDNQILRNWILLFLDTLCRVSKFTLLLPQEKQ